MGNILPPGCHFAWTNKNCWPGCKQGTKHFAGTKEKGASSGLRIEVGIHWYSFSSFTGGMVSQYFNISSNL